MAKKSLALTKEDVESIQRAQERSALKDDLSPFVGRWVALRDGHVHKVADTGEELYSDPEVASTDIIVRALPPDSLLIL